MYQEELSRLRQQCMDKDKRAGELASQAAQFNSMKQRTETYIKDISELRNRQREDQQKHKEEISLLKKENMRIRQLETQLKKSEHTSERA